MFERPRDARRSEMLFGAAGWLFADLLLALAMIFLLATSVGHVTATTAPTPTPTATLTPTPVPYGLEQNAVIVTLDAGLTPAAMMAQITNDPRLVGRHAGLVLLFGGVGSGDSSVGYAADGAVKTNVLQPLGLNKGDLFYDCVYRQFLDFGSAAGNVEVDIYLFKNK